MTTPDPRQLAQRLARQTVPPAPPDALPEPAVVFGYVDNSNVWIEGMRLQAVRQGLARDPYDAMQRSVTTPWSYDFGRLYELVCPVGSRVGRSILIGSRPPPNDSVWQRARDEGFEVKVYDRNVAGKEKQVDSKIITTLLDDSYQHMRSDRGDLAVLAAGDGDYLPGVESLHERGLRVRVVFWEHATSRVLRQTADHFIALDPYFDFLTHHQPTS